MTVLRLGATISSETAVQDPNPYTYAYGDPLNNPDLSGQDSLPEAGGTGGGIDCIPKATSHHSLLQDIGLGLGIAGAVVGVVALTIATGGVGDVLAGAALVLGAVSSGVDGFACVNSHGHDVTACAGAILAVAGAASGALSVGGLGEEEVVDLGQGRAALIGFTSVLGTSGGVTDAVAFFIPLGPCGA